MFLNANQIRERLERGDLTIDPLLGEEPVVGFTADLRLGTEFAEHPHPPLVPNEASSQPGVPYKSRTVSVELGEKISVQPRAGVLGVTLHIVRLPLDLAGFVFHRNTLLRAGLLGQTLLVHPGYEGKLVLPLYNVGRVPIDLCAGMLVAKLALSKLDVDPNLAPTQKYAPSLEPLATDVFLSRYHEATAAKLSSEIPSTPLSELTRTAFDAQGPDKGPALERVAAELFNTVEGLNVIKVNARLKAEEIDVLVNNESDHGFWRVAGSPVLVECKNWSGKVGSPEISILFDKLLTLGPDAKFGILIAPNGVTGEPGSDAHLKIREKRLAGRYILLIDRPDLEAIAGGAEVSDIVRRAYERTLLI